MVGEEDDGKCPYCHRNLAHFDHDGALKHIRACRKRRLGALKSNGRRGRPRMHHPISNGTVPDKYPLDDDLS